MSKYNFEQKRNDYLSPPEIIEIVLTDFNRKEFDLDVCSARTETKYWRDYILFKGFAQNPDVSVLFLQKGYKFLDPETQEPMGIFKNALALVTFWG